MPSTLQELLSRLAEWLEGLDPNIGKVFQGEVAWKSLAELRDGAGFRLRPGSEIDGDLSSGLPVVRFWTLSARTDNRALTNVSTELVHEVRVTGFYQRDREGGEPNERVMRKAVAMILERGSSRTVEMVTLNTGGGYLGYVSGPPRCESGVAPARLGGAREIAGYSATVVFVFHEELETGS